MRMALAFGLMLGTVSIVAVLDAARRLNIASVLADSGANPSREVVRYAEFNGVYVLGFAVGSVTAIMAILSVILLRIAVKAWRRGGEAAFQESAEVEPTD